jgi:hypothetical protein
MYAAVYSTFAPHIGLCLPDTNRLVKYAIVIFVRK